MDESSFNLKEEVSYRQNRLLATAIYSIIIIKGVLTDSNLNVKLVFPLTRIRTHQAPARLKNIHKPLDIRLHRQAAGAANPVSGYPDADRLVPIARDAGE